MKGCLSQLSFNVVNKKVAPYASFATRNAVRPPSVAGPPERSFQFISSHTEQGVNVFGGITDVLRQN
jgi:hypothetical protein